MDIRSKKTRRDISDCFLQLLREMHISKITVTQLCHRVGINRATFYKHFLDVYHLQSTLEAETLEELESYLRGQPFSGPKTYQQAVTELLRYVKQRREVYYTLCAPNGGSEFPSRIFQMLYSLSFPLIEERLQGYDVQKANLLYQYVSNGCGSILQSWFQGKILMSEAEVAAFIIRASSATVMEIAGEGAQNYD